MTSSRLLLFLSVCSLVASSATRADVVSIHGEPAFFEPALPAERGYHDAPQLIMLKDAQPLVEVTSEFQDISVYDTVSFGRMMVIDDVVMLTERDNHAYHEMIAHVPLNAHPNPRRVLIVGGGDGGTLREVLKHDSVQEVVACELDAEVIRVSREYFPELSSGYDDPRVTVVNMDAAVYMADKENYFDIILVDSTDPIGPGAVLFDTPFYKNMHNALTEDGIVVAQSESMYYHADSIAKWHARNTELFAFATYYFTVIPTYPSGTIGFTFCSKKYLPIDQLDVQRVMSLPDLQYYNLAIHCGSFAVPTFVQESIGL